MTVVSAIAGELERRILSGVYGVGTKLPTEPELATDFGVSRTSIRAAVGQLQARGFLSREQGRGTFVRDTNPVSLNMLLESNLSVSHVIEAAGYEPGIAELSVARVMMPTAICRELIRPPGSWSIAVRRIRTASGTAVADSVDYLVETPRLSSDERDYRGSLYDVIEAAYGSPIASATASISATSSNVETSARLGVPPSTALLLLRQTHNLADGIPVMYSIVSLRSDVVHLYVYRRQP